MGNMPLHPEPSAYPNSSTRSGGLYTLLSVLLGLLTLVVAVFPPLAGVAIALGAIGAVLGARAMSQTVTKKFETVAGIVLCLLGALVALVVLSALNTDASM